MVDSTEQMMTVPEAARILNVGRQTVRHMIARKEIEAVKIGTIWRINKTSFLHLIKGESHVSSSENRDDVAAGESAAACETANRRAPDYEGENGRDGETHGGASGRNHTSETFGRVRLIKTGK